MQRLVSVNIETSVADNLVNTGLIAVDKRSDGRIGRFLAFTGGIVIRTDRTYIVCFSGLKLLAGNLECREFGSFDCIDRIFAP